VLDDHRWSSKLACCGDARSPTDQQRSRRHVVRDRPPSVKIDSAANYHCKLFIFSQPARHSRRQQRINRHLTGHINMISGGPRIYSIWGRDHEPLMLDFGLKTGTCIGIEAVGKRTSLHHDSKKTQKRTVFFDDTD